MVTGPESPDTKACARLPRPSAPENAAAIRFLDKFGMTFETMIRLAEDHPKAIEYANNSITLQWDGMRRFEAAAQAITKSILSRPSLCVLKDLRLWLKADCL